MQNRKSNGVRKKVGESRGSECLFGLIWFEGTRRGACKTEEVGRLTIRRHQLAEAARKKKCGKTRS